MFVVGQIQLCRIIGFIFSAMDISLVWDNYNFAQRGTSHNTNLILSQVNVFLCAHMDGAISCNLLRFFNTFLNSKYSMDECVLQKRSVSTRNFAVPAVFETCDFLQDFSAMQKEGASYSKRIKNGADC